MDPVRNPFSPGSGSKPPVLAGRDVLLEDITVAMRRIGQGRSAKNFVLSGLRGVGKTVLLKTVANIADHEKQRSLMLEADDNRSLRDQIGSRFSQMLLQMDFTKKVGDAVMTGLRGVASFTKVARLKHGELEFALDFDPLVGTADSGNIADDLPDVFEIVGKAAASRNTAIVLIIDEMQMLSREDLVALIMAMHRVSQNSLPLLLVGGGLPQVVGLMGEAKGYSERLFESVGIGELPVDEACRAIVEPLQREGAKISKAALAEIMAATLRYPYFIQEWGKHAWNSAQGQSISITAAKAAHPIATASLDESFFRFRLDQLTDKEKLYARAMASLGGGPYKSGDIANALGARVESLAPIRGSLIKKGTVYSPSYGDTAFTVPLFHEFMCRVMPSFEKQASAKKRPARKKRVVNTPKPRTRKRR